MLQSLKTMTADQLPLSDILVPLQGYDPERSNRVPRFLQGKTLSLSTIMVE